MRRRAPARSPCRTSSNIGLGAQVIAAELHQGIRCLDDERDSHRRVIGYRRLQCRGQRFPQCRQILERVLVRLLPVLVGHNSHQASINAWRCGCSLHRAA